MQRTASFKTIYCYIVDWIMTPMSVVETRSRGQQQYRLKHRPPYRRGANHAARPLGKYFNSRPYPIHTVCRQDWYYLVHPATLKMFSLCRPTLVTLHHIRDFSGGWYHLIETYQIFQRIPSRRVTDFHCSTATAALVFATLHNIAITLT